MDNITKLIKTRYGPVIKFVDEFMGMKYRVFRYKVKTHSMNYDELCIILKALDIKFEDLQVIGSTNTQPIPPEPKKEKPKKVLPAPSQKSEKKSDLKSTGAPQPISVNLEPEVFGYMPKVGKLSDVMKAIKEDNEDLKK